MIAVGRGSLGLEKWVKGGYWHGETYYETEQESPVSKALLLSETTNVWGLFAPKVGCCPNKCHWHRPTPPSPRSVCADSGRVSREKSVGFGWFYFLKRWFCAFVLGKVLENVFKAGVGELTQDAGDPWKLTGTFVFARDGSVVYQMRQKSVSDSPNIEKLMQACRLAAGKCGGFRVEEWIAEIDKMSSALTLHLCWSLRCRAWPTRSRSEDTVCPVASSR